MSSFRNLVRYSVVGVCVLTIVNCASVAIAHGPPLGVPEIDPSSASSALALLGSGALILAERFGFRRK